FVINLTGTGPYGNQTVTLDCGESESLTVEAGPTYTISETPPDGYAEPSIRGLCDGDGTFTLGEGETGTCVVSNTLLDVGEGTASVTIMKECTTEEAQTEFVIGITGPGDFDENVTLNCGETSDPLAVD